MSKKHKKFCRVLNYIVHSLIVISTITGCVSISVFASLVGILIGIMGSEIGLITCIITAGIKKYTSKCIVCNSKKSKCIKEQEASGLLSSLGIKTLFNKIPLLGPVLF